MDKWIVVFIIFFFLTSWHFPCININVITMLLCFLLLCDNVTELYNFSATPSPHLYLQYSTGERVPPSHRNNTHMPMGRHMNTLIHIQVCTHRHTVLYTHTYTLTCPQQSHMYVYCAHVHVHRSPLVHSHVCRHSHIPNCIHRHIHMHIYTLYICTCIYNGISIGMCAYVYIDIYTCIHTFMCAYSDMSLCNIGRYMHTHILTLLGSDKM